MITKEELITIDEILMGRDRAYAQEFTKEIATNIEKLHKALTVVRLAYGQPMVVNSGWRPPSYNKTVSGAASKSLHMLGLACDIRDRDGSLKDFVLSRLDLMQQLGLYFEDFRWTKGWVHFQCIAPPSGVRIFVPYSNLKKFPMNAPRAWTGVYDHQYDGDINVA